MFYIILDNGHGKDTPGKCSPKVTFPYDKNFTSIENDKFREYRFNRRVVEALVAQIKKIGFTPIVLVPEEKDITLTERVIRINKYCSKYGAGNCVMVSIHVNAAGGEGKWLNARGWSIWTTKLKNNSDKLADCIYESALENIGKDKIYIDQFKNEKVQKPIRTDFYSDGDADYEANFTIIKGANCPSVLIENMFQDNVDDVKYLESKNGFDIIVKTVIDGLKNYSKKYNKK